MSVPAQKMTLPKPEFTKISDVIWDLSPGFKHGMRVPARIVATRKLIDAMDLQVYDQISNVATLPGIQKFAFCMPDGHSGYGFPIGGVAAFDVNEGGVISPGGIGFDINCGMRLVLTNLSYEEAKPELRTLVDKLFRQFLPEWAAEGLCGSLTTNSVNGSQWKGRNGLSRTATDGRKISNGPSCTARPTGRTPRKFLPAP